MLRVARSRWPNRRGPKGTSEGSVSAGRIVVPDGTEGVRHAKETDPPEAAKRLEPPDGRDGSSEPDHPPDGTRAGLNCRMQLCRSGRPKGTERPTRATGVTIRGIRLKGRS